MDMPLEHVSIPDLIVGFVCNMATHWFQQQQNVTEHRRFLGTTAVVFVR